PPARSRAGRGRRAGEREPRTRDPARHLRLRPPRVGPARVRPRPGRPGPDGPGARPGHPGRDAALPCRHDRSRDRRHGGRPIPSRAGAGDQPRMAPDPTGPGAGGARLPIPVDATMSELLTFVHLGFHHITDPEALDHMLFLLALAAIYRGRDWRDSLWVVTAF